MLADAGADADQLAHPGPGDHVGHAAVQLVVRIPALRDVRQHERRRTPQRHRVEVVQGQGQRVDVEVVGVVHEDRLVDSVLHFQTHGHRRTAPERGCRITHGLAECLHDLGVAARGGSARPPGRRGRKTCRVDQTPVGEALGDHRGQRLVVAVVHDRMRPIGQPHLLGALLLQRAEMLLMGVADRGEDHHVRTDHALQPLHLSGLRNSGLHEQQLLIALGHEQRQGHAELRIVALGRAVAAHARRHLLGDPLLEYGLAVRPRDAHHRGPALRPAVCGQGLQRVDGVRHLHRAAPLGHGRLAFDQKGAHAPLAHRVEEVVRVVVRAAHGDEHRAAPQLARKRTAVGNDRPHLGIAARKLSAANGGNT